MRKRNQYSLEWKRGLVDAVLSKSRKVSELAREHGIHPSQIYQWVKRFEGGGSDAEGFTSSDRERQRLKAELNRYKQKVGELTLENDFLKKVEERSRRQRRVQESVISGRNWEPFKQDAE